MGDELEKQFNAQIDLIAGSNGIYDVEVDGKMIFSKAKAGRFPELDEIISLINSL